jgi:hypothetical protein
MPCSAFGSVPIRFSRSFILPVSKLVVVDKIRTITHRSYLDILCQFEEHIEIIGLHISSALAAHRPSDKVRHDVEH